MAKEAAVQNAPAMLHEYKQAISAGNVTPTWAQYPRAGTTGFPNVMWQNTSSGATYCSASSVLKP